MDYSELRQAILDESLRGDLVDQVPLFVERAEGMIARELRCMEMLERVLLVEADRVQNGRYRLPGDWLEDRAVIAGGRAVRKTSLDSLYQQSTSGAVVAYAVLGDSVDGNVIEFRGWPGTDAEIEVHYFARPAPLLQDTDTNRLLEAHPAIYQDAALFHLYKFTQDADQAQAAYDTWSDARATLNEQAGRFLAGSNARPKYNMGRFSAGGGY
jgi:hypothetical protein